MNPQSGIAHWPATAPQLTPERRREISARIRPAFGERLGAMQIDASLAEALEQLYLPLAAWIVGRKTDTPLVLGINGAQGSGKSTLCELLGLLLGEGFGYRVAGFSIDDIYKTRAERERLAETVHPLLITRGVPGTHDVALGIQVIESLKQADAATRTAIPSFDKAVDDRRPEAQWPRFEGPADIIIFEGWCVGCRPQSEADLVQPVNPLEADEDADGRWRHYVNAQLAGDYARLYSLIDTLIMLRIPAMESVFEWRGLQEQKLAAQRGGAANSQIMDSAALQRFIMHYERLTRHSLEEMPGRADLTLYLNERHQISEIRLKD